MWIIKVHLADSIKKFKKKQTEFYRLQIFLMMTALSTILRVFLSFYSSVLQISMSVLLTDVFFRFAGWSSKNESDRRENDKSESVRKERDWRRRDWRERDKLQQVWKRPLADHIGL